MSDLKGIRRSECVDYLKKEDGTWHGQTSIVLTNLDSMEPFAIGRGHSRAAAVEALKGELLGQGWAQSEVEMFIAH